MPGPNSDPRARTGLGKTALKRSVGSKTPQPVRRANGQLSRAWLRLQARQKAWAETHGSSKTQMHRPGSLKP
jgi:hypothetical protein